MVETIKKLSQISLKIIRKLFAFKIARKLFASKIVKHIDGE